MSKYKVGDKVVMEIISADQDEIKTYSVSGVNDDWRWCLPQNLLERYTEPLSTYTEPLKAKIRRQAAEITRLLRENKELKNEKQELTRERNQLMGRCGGLSAAKIKAFNNGRLAGQNEAWELARKCMLMTDRERKAIFGSGHNALYGFLTYFDYEHAAAKVAAWEKAKEEIKVGDEVEKNDLRDVRFIVTFTNGKLMSGVTQSGLVFANEKPKEWHKTGRHIDIDSFLKQIGGAE